MALTRNEYAVHEVTGCFEKIVQSSHIPITLGEIDLRIFQSSGNLLLSMMWLFLENLRKVCNFLISMVFLS